MRADTDNLAVLFCGQGVAVDGDRELVASTRTDLLELACELIGDDPFDRAGEGTRFAQPALYCAHIARFASLGRPRGAMHAGHSLGELAALATAEALDELDGLRVAVARGRLMHEAAATSAGGMLAFGGDRAAALGLAEGHGLTLANENSPEQFVLSGPLEGIERAAQQARAEGLRAKRLAVAGAFHSPQMRPAVAEFRAALDEVEFRPAQTPVISGVTAEPFDADPRPALADALVSPVRWVQVLQRLSADGARRFLDVGPGKVLAGLVRRTLVDVEALTAKDLVAHA